MQMYNALRIRVLIMLTTAIIFSGCSNSVNRQESEISKQNKLGVISKLPNGKYLLQTFQDSANLVTPFSIQQFQIPIDVSLRTQHFENRSAIERYLLEQYVGALNPDDPPLNECDTSSCGTGGGTFSGLPRIFIILPTSGPAFIPIAIGGTNFAKGTIPYINGVPSIALFNFSLRNIPLIGSISVGFTIVPPEAPPGPFTVTIEYFGQRSNPFPFTKN